MNDQSNFAFNHRRGPVFSPDGVEASSPAPTSSASGGVNDSMSQYKGMFEQNMADQMALYGETNKLNQQKNTMQSIMDVGMKAGKAVST